MNPQDTQDAAEKKTDTLSEMFNSFVKDSGMRFPALEGRLLLMDVADYKVYGLYGLDKAKIKMDPEQILAYLGRYPTLVHLRNHPEQSSCACYDPASGTSIIFFNDKIDPDVAKIALKLAKQRTLHVLDHELGHLGIEDGLYEDANTPQGVLGENIADAYALIRHYQRFGTHTVCNDKYVSAFARASTLIFGGDASHFTTFTLQAVSNARNTLDVHNLDAAATARLARTYALRHTPNPERVKKLLDTFRPVKEVWQQDLDAALQKLIDITLDPANDADVFRTGEVWLRPFLKGDLTFENGKAPVFLAQDVQTLKRRLDERMFSFARAAKTAHEQVRHPAAVPPAQKQTFG